MNRLLKYALQMGMAFVLVWTFVVLLFTDEVVFTKVDNSDNGAAAGDVVVDDVADGTYTGEGEGFGGPIEVEVTVADGKITTVDILSQSETEGVSDPAIEEIPAAIVQNNSTDVDTVSGASHSSQGIIDAVNDALGADTSANESEDNEDQAGDSAPAETDYTDGTYTAKADGNNGPVEVEVVIKDGAIAEVNVLDHSETEGLSDPAIDDIPAEIVKKNSTDVDTVSGATHTSEAIIEAVDTALEEASK